MRTTSARETLGEVLRDARGDLPLRALAKELKITPSYLSHIEHDRRIPADEVMQRLASRLGLRFDALMSIAGQLSKRAKLYLKREDVAGRLIHFVSEKDFSQDQLLQLLRYAEELTNKRRR